jgi:uncharacterized protein (TIGR00255 family)
VIRSMTGFAAVTREGSGARVHVTIKTVNHRFLDVVVKAPAALGAVESAVRALVPQKLTRGRVEIAIALELTAAPERDVTIDLALIERIGAAVESARERGVLTGNLTVSDVLRIPQVLEIRSRAGDAATPLPADVPELVTTAVADTLDALVTMRQTEGGLLATDIDARIQTLTGFATEFERCARDGQQQLEARLRARLADLPPDLQGDPVAMGQEVVRFVSRSDVDEELVRLRAHVEHWRVLSTGPEACGRKLDFLVQEMNREINTIGAKVEGAARPDLVISAKAELERVREQVQNVE